MRIPHIAALTVLLLGTGCITTYTGPRLLSPSVPRGLSPPEVNSLQPTLTWEPSYVPGTTYDLVVYERSPIPVKPYVREGLMQTSHRVEKPLLPGREYVWAVRANDRNTAGPWSSYSYFDFYVLWFTWGRYQPYRFTTSASLVRQPDQTSVPGSAAEPPGGTSAPIVPPAGEAATPPG